MCRTPQVFQLCKAGPLTPLLNVQTSKRMDANITIGPLSQLVHHCPNGMEITQSPTLQERSVVSAGSVMHMKI